MRFLSLFDGIGAASVAWESLGWECAGVSEIEAFQIAVTQHHRPHVPHLGDVTKITEQQIAALGRIDLIVGGFPCQDLSVAGKRAGLKNDDGTHTRSGLFFDAMRIVQWARKHCGLRWLLIENVPGLFSSNRGRDFAAVVGAMVGTSFDVPGDGWRNAGVAVGPDGKCEWCALDAQFFNLAQRRVRVFALADFGDWRRAAAVLFEPASLRGDSAPGRETGQRVANSLVDRPDRGGGNSEGQRLISGTITANSHSGRTTGTNPIADNLVTHSLRAEGFDASEDGTGRGIPLVAGCLNSAGGHAVPGNSVQDADQGYLIPTSPPIAHCLNAGGMGRQDYETETLVPVRTGGGFDVTPFDTTQITSAANRSNPKAGDPSHPLAAGAHSPAICFHNRQDPDVSGDVTHPIGAKDNGIGVGVGMGVRRLTPRECERLQGFPDDYTLTPYRGKPAKDWPRYKALGNSMAVPVMAWIGARIAMTAASAATDQEDV